MPSSNQGTSVRKDLFPSIVDIVIGLLLLLKLIIPYLIHPDFGFHRDEFLYKAMGDHLAWGFMEVPPFIAVMAKVTHGLLGEGLYATRFLPALSGALILLLTIQMTKELGGDKYAQILAAAAYLFSLVYLRINTLFQPVTFDLFFFVLAAYLFIRILKDNSPLLWFLFGLTLGVGLLNKYTMLFFGFGVFISLLLTRYRKYFLTPWPWIAAGLALLIWLPNLLWQYQNGWPFFEHMQALSETQLVNFSPLDFILGQMLMSPFTVLIWIPGLYFFFFTEAGKLYRPLGWIYVTVFLVLLVFSGKQYYLAPAYPMLFAGGSTLIEDVTRRSQSWIRYVVLSLVISGGLLLTPVGIPIFSVQGMHQYFDFGSQYLGLGEALRWETGEYHELPQDFADMLGWEEQAAAISRIYTSMPVDDSKNTTVITSNYGEAGALTHYQDHYLLPETILSVVGSFYSWGPPPPETNVIITVGFSEETLKKYFHQVNFIKSITHKHARENNISVFLCRVPVGPINSLWNALSIYKFN